MHLQDDKGPALSILKGLDVTEGAEGLLTTRKTLLKHLLGEQTVKFTRVSHHTIPTRSALKADKSLDMRGLLKKILIKMIRDCLATSNC